MLTPCPGPATLRRRFLTPLALAQASTLECSSVSSSRGCRMTSVRAPACVPTTRSHTLSRTVEAAAAAGLASCPHSIRSSTCRRTRRPRARGSSGTKGAAQGQRDGEAMWSEAGQGGGRAGGGTRKGDREGREGAKAVAGRFAGGQRWVSPKLGKAELPIGAHMKPGFVGRTGRPPGPLHIGSEGTLRLVRRSATHLDKAPERSARPCGLE